jgi:2-keto-4-pentenoate hydratase/2-oxohepta-3-ene-1,7-dioic acid hydratase in catechol pathway
MKIIRYQDTSGRTGYACDRGNGEYRKVDGGPFGPFTETSEPVSVRKLLAPVEPAQILCIGLNYRQHAAESGAKVPDVPVLFVKGINTLQHPGEPIVLPRFMASEEVDYECELAVVIGRGPGGRLCKNVRRAEALQYVLGYTCANDVSARDWQIRKGGGQWCRGKFFDTFAPLGPCLVTSDEIRNPNTLPIRTILNGKTVQDWNTNDMIFDVPALIEFLSGSTTLVPGTVILTGTPQGVGMAAKPQPLWLRPGDEVTIEIDGIGRLSNPVVAETV